MSGLPAFGDLKPPVKAALVVATGGSLMAGLGILFAKQWPIILAGVALIAVVIVAYKAVLKLLDKRKQAPMLKALSGHSAGAPKGINDPARRARLDDMRKNFEGGVEKFKDAGKNIYSLPWYLLVGEPGSGKTEAIRHCKVGFPPGLQDQLQGVGGTINMNWWFTNHAVILDTAGRLMFEEVEPGSTSEWQEFLKLLKKNRANCPVNGMLLVIPSESLIRDNAEAIERKGGKIAQQLDQIQRALGVRFPVFVIVTKCDLVNGFREFFDDLTEPQVQDQILGWSNPNPLDTPFNPEQVDQHLATVQQRLVRRRLGLMLDPVNTEDASRRRTDQVDALFAFPESFMKIAPRLRRYLEMIFVAGEWSAKPLFLRGIYFNSSMREGSALDADLAEALGMPVESLPEGRVWERDRAYFLRDLFLNKVFRERGLVTRAINTGQHLRKRKLAVFGTAAVGAVAITLFTIFGWLQLTKRVVAPGEFWVGVERAYSADLSGDRENANPLAKYQPGSGNEYLYTGHYIIRDVPALSGMQEEQKSVAGFPAALVEQAKDPIGLPAIFAPVAFLFGDNTGDLEKDARRGAVGAVMEVSVLRPVVGLAQKKMREELSQPAQGWSPEASEALVQLLRLEVDRLSGVKEPRPVSVTPLVRYLMGAEAFDKDPKRKEALDKLDEALRWEYSFDKDSTGKEQGHRRFPAPAIGADFTDQLPEALKRFRESWKPDGSATELALVTSIGDALKALSGHEAELQRLKASAALSDSEALAQWAARLEAVRKDGKLASDLLTQLRQKRPTDRSLAQSYDQALKAYVETGRSMHQRMIGELAGVADKEGGGPPAIKADAKTEQARFDALRSAHADLLRSAAALEQTAGGGPERRAEIDGYDTHFLRGSTKDDAYAVRLGMYEEADKHAAGAGTAEAIQLGTLKPRMETLTAGLDESRGKITQMEAAARGDKELPKTLQEKMTGAVAIANYALDKGAAVRRAAMVSEWIKNLPETAADFGKAVESYAEASKAPAPMHPTIPMTVGAGGKFDAKYNPDAAAALLGDCAAVLVIVPVSQGEAAAGVSTGPIAAASVEKVKRVYDGYAQAYLGYWSSEMRKHIKVDVPTKGWTAFANELAVNSQTDTFNRALSELATTINKAVSAVKPVIKPEPGRPAALTPDAILAQVESTRATLGNDVSSKNFRTVHQQWRALSPTPSAARKTVLDAATRFSDDYMPVRPAGYDTAAPLGDFATAFWEDLALTALERLALQCRDEGEDALRRLRANKRFPLGPLGPDGQQLLAADVVDMRELITKVGVQAPGGTTPSAAVPPPAPGGRADASANLAILRNPTKLEEGDSKWLEWAASMLAALPTRKDETFTCTISYLRGPETEKVEESTQYVWPDMGLGQGAADLPWRGVRQEDVKELGKVAYPGDDLRLRFFKNAAVTATPDHETKIPAPWAALRLLYSGYAAVPPEKMNGDARIWKVKVLIDDPAGGKRSLWLKLEFQQELPDPRSWPR